MAKEDQIQELITALAANCEVVARSCQSILAQSNDYYAKHHASESKRLNDDNLRLLAALNAIVNR